MRHQIVPCPGCRDIFVSAPGTCPDCGTEVPAPPPEPEELVVPYRLNRLAAAGGVALGGLMTGSVSILLGRADLGVGLLALGLVIAALLLAMR